MKERPSAVSALRRGGRLPKRQETTATLEFSDSGERLRALSRHMIDLRFGRWTIGPCVRPADTERQIGP